MLEQLCAALSSRGLHFYMLRPLRLTSAVSEVAMAYTQTTVGAACGVPQGELQGSLSNLRTICTILTPMIWSRVYGYGVRVGVPSLFYYVSAAGGLLQLVLLRKLVSAPEHFSSLPRKAAVVVAG